VQASRERIVRAADTERRRVERDLHDGAQQRLLGLALALHTARRQLAAGEPAALARTLDRAGAELASAISELRELARGIHPSVLTDGGLAPALEMLAGRAPFPVAVEVDDERYPPMVEGTAYFVVSEALANAAKHAAARRGAVTVRPVDSALLVEVCDDGRGIGDHSDGTGLAGLRDRVAAVGGDFTVDSTPGAGTSIRALLPLRAAS
jgi:signal transduction histidine kinase